MEQINSTWSLEKCFEALRQEPRFHLGLGDIRITQGMQEEIARLVDREKLEFTIKELEMHIEHPTKPGYRRHDILNKIKELREKLSKL